ncbi:MAG: Na+/H+ antiporter subunit G [Rhodobacter sp.]|uniref:Na+/H+ antiporter subunit G n=1 Tax=Pararhodobacter sp. TaxID=2127056 RepID=UPI001DA3239E|nr:Na+/H+ antiporter subunit G [Pararhodobacter sp.]MCB1345767.1 Na+/H+ antiporter subunit G [Paracoccaceae bacterium]MCC0074417.1 Na+/H+ antiporter subunit G [Rhodobacter sp.]HPD91397.1 Na+/H+ antiporter subunit G [Pararhodobacter sp.]
MTDLPLWAEISVSVFLVIAGVFGLIGSYGLVRLPDPMTRLHAPTKATTLGVGGVLIASMLFVYATEGRVSLHELLIALFLFLSSPITALFIAKVHLHLREDQSALPQPGDGMGWAGYTVQTPARGVRESLDEDDDTAESR